MNWSTATSSTQMLISQVISSRTGHQTYIHKKSMQKESYYVIAPTTNKDAMKKTKCLWCEPNWHINEVIVVCVVPVQTNQCIWWATSTSSMHSQNSTFEFMGNVVKWRWYFCSCNIGVLPSSRNNITSSITFIIQSLYRETTFMFHINDQKHLKQMKLNK
jgi:hypothetical protein